MDSNQPAPTRLKIVAGVFIFNGVCSIIAFLLDLFDDRFFVDLRMVYVFVGWGLIRYRRGWRTCALVFLWFELIGILLISVMLIFLPGPIYFQVFGIDVAPMREVYAHAMGAALFALAVWEYHVLTRPDIRKLFGVEAD